MGGRAQREAQSVHSSNAEGIEKGGEKSQAERNRKYIFHLKCLAHSHLPLKQ